MRYQNQNPVYSRYKHLLPKTGRYPAEQVDIFWNRNKAGKVKDVEAVFIPREALNDKDLQDEYAAFNKRWDSDLGNSCSDWMKKDGNTPASIFGHLLHYGFASESEMVLALKEFANIEECGWARQMLRGYRDE